MKVWIMTGVNYGNYESTCDFRHTLAVFDHEPDNIEKAVVSSDAVAGDRFGDGFDEYEIQEFEVNSSE